MQHPDFDVRCFFINHILQEHQRSMTSRRPSTTLLTLPHLWQKEAIAGKHTHTKKKTQFSPSADTDIASKACSTDKTCSLLPPPRASSTTRPTQSHAVLSYSAGCDQRRGRQRRDPHDKATSSRRPIPPPNKGSATATKLSTSIAQERQRASRQEEQEQLLYCSRAQE